MNELLVLLLPLAAFSGWWLARSDNKNNKEQKTDDYFRGLGYLLEDKTDQAIDIFVKIAHLDSSTIENQITLGNLFRYRGEVDRALHIHSTLAEKANMSDAIQQRLNLVLAEDYLASGIMNHAEKHYLLACEGRDPEIRKTAQKQLVALYSEQAQWEKAIEVGRTLDPLKKDKVQQHIAHFYCELAKAYLNENNEELALKKLKKALACDKNCVRATLKLGRLSAEQKDYVAAISYFNMLEKQNPAFLPEIIDDLANCYNNINQKHEWAKALKAIAQKYNNPVLILYYHKFIIENEGAQAAKQFLQQHLEKRPNILLIQAYLQLINSDTDNNNNSDNTSLIRNSIDKVLGYALKYRCCECGFRGNHLNWQCPGCKQWGTFTPISDLSLKENIS